jgi:hypothetical protein
MSTLWLEKLTAAYFKRAGINRLSFLERVEQEKLKTRGFV